MPYFPTRSAGVLQSRFCVYLNRRDRSRDPPRLNLPPEFAAEAVVDWNSIHGFQVDRRALDAPQSESSASKSTIVPINYLPAHDTHSSSEYNMHHSHKRPRRNVQVVDYTWPRPHMATHQAAESADDDSVIQNSRRSSLPFGSLEPSEAASNVPDTVIPIEKALDMDFVQEDARLVTSMGNLPYLSWTQKGVLNGNNNGGEWDQLGSREWQGSVVHVDFSLNELDAAELVATKILRSSRKSQSSSRRKRLQKLLRNQPEPKLVRIACEIRRVLPLRDRACVDAFLEDARQGKLPKTPRVLRLGAARVDPSCSSKDKSSLASRISQREMGLQSRRGWRTASKPLSYQIKNKVYDTMGPAYSFTGASSDVHTVAWSPDGQFFAAGAVCVTDPDSMQYNRRENLLYGDFHTKTIQELAEHRVDRPILESGPNSTHAMRESQDRKLYTTVSAVAFSPDGNYIFSAGYDKNVCIWETQIDGSQPILSHALKHRAEVDLLAVSCTGKLATAAKRWERAIKVISAFDQNEIEKASYTSRKADERPDQNILPSALQFEPNFGRLLLAGFGANKRHDRMDINGDICLWDVETQQELHVHGSTKNVFDATFNPRQIEQPLFAVGCVAGANVNRGTRSIVRFYDGRGWGKYTMNMEVECPALDMNDVRFCPYDENLVAAGCTSGRTYIWDIRRPDAFLYKLAHGKSLMPLDDYIDPEITDTGIRFLSWGENATRLYTGSSDGVVKVWDVARPQSEVFIKDLITVDSGIMSGAFSPDFSRLVVGEVNGSVNVLEVGKDDFMIKDMERLKHIPYEEATFESEPDSASILEDYDSGRAVATELLATGQIVNIPMGDLPMRQAVQGPNYAGPFDSSVDASYLREQALGFQYNIARTPGPQCNIPTCKDSFMKVTSEEIGDSGRSKDRIPDELRKQWKLVGSDLTVIPGKTKCATCGRPARPLDTPSATDTPPLCERCSFACFRCGGSIRMDPATDKLVCRDCLRAWDIGALGYECVDDNSSKAPLTDVPSLTGFGKEIAKDRGDFMAENVSFGDEMNALTDHYFALAIARPESPPL
ncbi:WD40 repeat-like protein [Lophiostoma macrostomum CBS 122681]|uniref:WD40 repeat-like protein n=1 Tax=Lophiostoma macrostomum CBS 122681 TaxID=1314788 RepID=A0A6A6TJP8_9PLEO|nr:WD40 repeat-like protein [Lophiostoma macrostomum CBS 122681]